ncbi:MAG: CHRD domain-containing protein, partial [Planctomycetes bacterium]|nr:CHRD domain-containing protein [Planctomycetota bacterium]
TLQPLGELRGQLQTARAHRFVAALSGAQQVPPVATAGSGQLEALLYEPEHRLVYFAVTSGLGAVLSAELRLAPAGSNGPLVASLTGAAAGGAAFCGATDRLTASAAAALLANDVYLTVKTSSHPNGEVRGQLERDIGPFVGALSGLQVVPPIATPASGGVQVAVRPDGSVVVDGGFTPMLGTPLAVEVRNAPPGSNGPLVFSVPWHGASFSGTHTPTAPQLNDLLAGNWYCVIESTAHRQGELRAQLLVGARPTTFGGGCTGSNGRRPMIGARQGAVIGTPFSMDLFAVGANAIALLAFGPERDTFGGAAPLPLAAQTVGVPAPSCYLLLEPQLLVAALADASGCASLGLDLPVDPALRGSRHCAQWFVLDGPANQAGLVASNALYFVIE